ncbi:MAG: N-acetyltransferase [Deferribacterota bacterium]|nr:N-acetyltransferase [Deferribacterota bacterium]
MFKIREAQITDALSIQKLVNIYAAKGKMLPLSLNDVYERILEFVVCEIKDEIIGCCALHPTWEDLAEIRSLAVDNRYQGQDIGQKMVKLNIEKAENLGFKRVFALTYKPNFFKKLGFYEIDKGDLPKKIWTDCLKCIKFPNCDEIALIYIINK